MRMILAVRHDVPIRDQCVRYSSQSRNMHTTEPSHPIQLLQKAIVIHPDIRYLSDVARARDVIERQTGVRTLEILECSEGFAEWYRARAMAGWTCNLDAWRMPPRGHGLAAYPDIEEPVTCSDGDALVLLEMAPPRFFYRDSQEAPWIL